MKGIHPLKNGHWRVNIMVNGERMTKTCKTYDEALHVAEYIRLFLKLKHQDQKEQIMYNVNKSGQIVNEGVIIANVDDAANNAKASLPQTFTFPATGQGVRIIEKDGEPWFVARDVCDCLGLTNTTVALAGLDEDERSKVFLGRQGDTNIISESGLYALVFRSNKPEARAFSKWVRSEVLPAIRRTGGYIIAQPEETPETLMARALFVAKDALDRVNKQLEAAQPKVEVYERLCNSEGTYTLTEAAKHFNLSARRLNTILREECWLFKNAIDKHGHPINPVHLPCQNIIDKGYAVVKSRTTREGFRCTQSYITPRGLIAIERLLHKRYAV